MLFGESFKLLDEPAVSQAIMKPELPDDEPFERFAVREPFVRYHSQRLVVCRKHASLFGRVGKEDAVGRFLGKDINGSLYVPPAKKQAIHELLTDVIVCEERESMH